MKKILCLCILAIVISTLSIEIRPITLEPLTLNAAALVNNTINPQHTMKLVFNDEFNGTSLNASKWINRLQWGRTNEPELQYYASNAFAFKYGSIHLTARKKPTFGMPYSSGAIATYGHFKFTYGVVKIRARIPAGKGLWPALWLLDYDGGAQEIDIAEFLGHQPTIAYMTLHYPTSNGNKSLGGHFTGPNFSSGFHIFTVDWNRNGITWYVDGIQRYRQTQHIPSKPMYLIMNLAVGGDWPGYPSIYTKFPAYFNIDYVRIYQMRP